MTKKDKVMKTASRTIMAAAMAIVIAGGGLHAQTSNSISIEKPFSRATPGGAQVGAGYMTITNKGAAADRLMAAASPAAGQVQIHEMSMDGGIMKMRELASGLTIGAGKTVALAPGGYHLMLMGLKAPLKAGDKVPVTLTFEKAGKVDVSLDVQGIGGPPPHEMPMPPSDGGHMHKM